MKKNLLSIIILALLVVSIVLQALTMVSVTSATSKISDLVADISTVIGIDIEGLENSGTSSSVSMADTQVYDITDLTIPLKATEGDSTTHYAVGTVSLSMNTTHEDYATYGDSETFATREGLVKDVIFSVFANYTMQDAQTNSAAIKEEILQGIQDLFGSDFIYNVSFSFLYS